MFAYCLNNPINGCDSCGTCFHRCDFWNDCENCGGKKLIEKIDEEIALINGFLDKSVAEIESSGSTLGKLVSGLNSNAYKSIHGMYQVGSGIGKMADGIMLIVAPIPTPLDDMKGLILLGWGGITIHNGLIEVLEVGLDEMAQ